MWMNSNKQLSLRSTTGIIYEPFDSVTLRTLRWSGWSGSTAASMILHDFFVLARKDAMLDSKTRDAADYWIGHQCLWTKYHVPNLFQWCFELGARKNIRWRHGAIVLLYNRHSGRIKRACRTGKEVVLQNI